MKELLTVAENKVIPSAYVLTIPEFKALSINELSYVYFYCDHSSPYAPYDAGSRHEKLVEDLKVKRTTKLQQAIDKYNENYAILTTHIHIIFKIK